MATCASGDLICKRPFSWWPILYSWIILKVLFCTHISPCLTYSLLVPHPLDLVCTVVALLFSLFASPWWAYHHVIDILWLRALTSGDLFCTYPLSWWLFLFKMSHSMAYSVYIPPCVYLFYISTTSSWPSLYTPNFYGLICLFTSTWRAYVYVSDILWLHADVPLVTYSVHLPPLIDLFCTYETYWLTILYTNHPMLTYSF